MKKYIPIFAIALVFLFLILFLFYSRYSNSTPRLSARITIKDTTVTAEMVSTPQALTRGLSGRENLNDGSGMLFVFNTSGKHSFWMKDMKFPIDIIWIDENLRVVDLKADVPPESYPELFTPRMPSRYVLEVQSGFVEAHKISIGDAIGIDTLR